MQQQIAAQTHITGVVPEEKLYMEEVGYKGDLFEHRIRILLAGYLGGATGGGRPVSASQVTRKVSISGPKLKVGRVSGRALRISVLRASVAAASRTPACDTTTP